jgi:hypothetical protein
VPNASALQTSDRVEQRSSLLGELSKGCGKAALPFARQLDVGDPRVVGGAHASHQAGVFRAVDEFRDGALCEVKSLGELGDRRALLAALRPFDEEQEQITLRRELGLACRSLRFSEEAPQRDAKFRDSLHVLDRERDRLRLGAGHAETVSSSDTTKPRGVGV